MLQAPACATGTGFNRPLPAFHPETTSQHDAGVSLSRYVEAVAKPVLVAPVEVRLLAFHRNNLFGLGAPCVAFEKRGSPVYGRNAGGWKPTRQHQG